MSRPFILKLLYKHFLLCIPNMWISYEMNICLKNSKDMGKLNEHIHEWVSLSNHKYKTAQKVKLPGFLNLQLTFLSQVFWKGLPSNYLLPIWAYRYEIPCFLFIFFWKFKGNIHEWISKTTKIWGSKKSFLAFLNLKLTFLSQK